MPASNRTENPAETMPSFRRLIASHPRRPSGLAAAAAALALVVGLGAAAAQDAPAPEATPGEAGPAAGAAVPIAAANPLGVLLPDSELVYGPALTGWDVAAFVDAAGGYLARVEEPVDGATLGGAEIVTRVAQAYSVSPRLLLALVEMHSGWVRDPNPPERTFPVGEPVPGLYAGLGLAADALNGFFYGHRHAGLRAAPLADGGAVDVPGANAATFALVAYLGRGETAATWAGLQEPSRFYGAYVGLFGDPMSYVGETALPAEPPPVTLALPFPAGEVWYYVAGPQSPWGARGPRARIDFAPPPADTADCRPSGAWVTAAAPGLVTRSDPGGVVVSLGGSIAEGTGWAHVYTHLAALDRIAAGARVRTGDRLGHPSCEGGLPTQARVGFARKYQGAWIPVDAAGAPLVLGGWAAIPGAGPGEGALIHSGASPRTAGPVKSGAVNGVTALPAAP